MAEEEVKQKSSAKSSGDAPTKSDKSQQQKGKKKKHPPDRQQPAWLFPPDEENPVLNPKPKSHKQAEKETAERLEAINFLKHKAVSAAFKDAPPADLLSMVGAFLTSIGFNHTCRVYTQEWIAKAEILDDWVYDSIGKKKFPKRMPNLLQVYTKWRREWDAEHGSQGPSSSEDSEGDSDGEAMSVDGIGAKKETNDSSSSSDSEDAMSLDEKPKSVKAQARKATETRSNGTKKVVATGTDSEDSDSSSESDSASNEPRQKAKGARAKATLKLTNDATRKDTISSSSSVTSESDADDEKGVEVAKKGLNTGPTQPATNNLKRKASASDAPADSKSTAKKPKEDGPASVTQPPKKKAKLKESANKDEKEESTQKKSKKTKAAPESTPNSEPKTSTKFIPPHDPHKVHSSRMANVARASEIDLKPGTFDSNTAPKSTMANGTSDTRPFVRSGVIKIVAGSSSSESSSSSDSAESSKEKLETKVKGEVPAVSTSSSKPRDDAAFPAPTQNGHAKAKAPKKKPNAPFQRISSDTKVDPKYASNAYVPNAYADRAHQDLSVTRGKGFTKEKNKKKKGSYRGGMIDIGGSKGVKFED